MRRKNRILQDYNNLDLTQIFSVDIVICVEFYICRVQMIPLNVRMPPQNLQKGGDQE